MYKSIGKVPLQIINIISWIFMVSFNYASQTIPLNQKTMQELSAKYMTLLSPAPYAFMIWTLIYALLLVFVIYQARDLFRKNKVYMPFLKDIGLYFFLSSILNVLWLFAWHYERIFLSLVILILLLITLIMIYTNIYSNNNYSLLDKIIVRTPFSIYFAWVTVAVFINTSIFLKSVDFGMTDELFLILSLVLLFIITLIIAVKYKDIAFVLTIIWGISGIIAARFSVVEPIFEVFPESIAFLTLTLRRFI